MERRAFCTLEMPHLIIVISYPLPVYLALSYPSQISIVEGGAFCSNTFKCQDGKILQNVKKCSLKLLEGVNSKLSQFAFFTALITVSINSVYRYNGVPFVPNKLDCCKCHVI